MRVGLVGYIKKKMPQKGQNILTMNLFHGKIFKIKTQFITKKKTGM
jgi:hypothetical protein